MLPECCEPGRPFLCMGSFSIFLSRPLHRRNDAMPGPGHKIASASRLRNEAIQLEHITLQAGCPYRIGVTLAAPAAGIDTTNVELVLLDPDAEQRIR